jgi:hypothetical protein
METWTIARILNEPEFISRRSVFVRVVNDLPGDESWLKKEQQLRDLTARRPSGRLTFAEIIRFGLWDFVALLWRRRKVAAAIGRVVASVAAGKIS